MQYIGDHQKVLKCARCQKVPSCGPAGHQVGSSGKSQPGHWWSRRSDWSKKCGAHDDRRYQINFQIDANRGWLQVRVWFKSVGSDNCEQTTPSARRLGVTQREYSDSLTLDSGRCEHRLHNAVSLLRDLSACIIDATHFGLPLVSAFMAIDNERPTPKRHPVEVRGTPHTQIHRCRNATWHRTL